MATVDYSIGATHYVTITNKLPAEKKVFFMDNLVDGKINDVDAGYLQHQQILELAADETIDGVDRKAGEKYFVEKNDRWAQLYRVNQWVLIPGGDTLKLAVETSEEVAYFMSLNGDTFTVAVA
jgi:hypothetical protein